VIFPRTYEKFKHLLAPDTILFFRGKLKANDQGGGGGNAAATKPAGETSTPTYSIMPDEIMDVATAAGRYVSEISLALTESEALEQIVIKNPDAPQNNNGRAAPEPAPQQRFAAIVAILKRFTGKVPVYFHLELEKGPGAPALVIMRAGNNIFVDPVPELFVALRTVLKPGAIRVIGEGCQARKVEVPAWKRRALEAPAAAAGQ
jgi:hypothetical protein